MSHRRATLALGLFVSSLGACGGDSTPMPDGPVHQPAPGEYRPDRVGYVELVEGNRASAYAAFQDRPELPTAALAEREGECAVYVRPRPATCDAACTTGVCTAPNTCTPWPANASAGPVSVAGLRAPLTFRAGPFGYVPDPQPGEDLFEPGASIRITAPGEVTEGFTATFTGVAPLTAPFQNIALVSGQDATITWTAAGSARVQVALVVGWHGAPYEAMLLCDSEDDGELTIPGSIITKLPRASSNLEPHNSTIMRYERAVVTVPSGPVELVIGSQQPIYFGH